MKYKLEFIKIGPSFEIAGVGFAGNIFITLNALTHINSDDKLFVDMETNECICTEKDIILHNTKNSWEYYFEQSRINEGEEFLTMNSLLSAKINYDDREMFMYPENFIELKSKFYNSFQLKSYLKELINNFYVNNIKDKITLGVQIRLTDMKHYHNVASVDKYILKIKEILNQRPEIEQIFLATDDELIIPVLKENINIPILYYDGIFRADNNNRLLEPDDKFKDKRELHRYRLGIEVMQDIFTLTKCDYLLKADISSVSIVASILSENIKQVYRL